MFRTEPALFKAALEAVGFKVTGLAGRVRWMSPPDSPLGPREHMMLKVDLPKGGYLADVGFGACLLDAPLQLKTDVEQTTAMGDVPDQQADGLLSLSAKRQAGLANDVRLQPGTTNSIRLRTWQLVHIDQPACAVLTSRLIMERLTGDRRYKLVDRKFLIEARDGEVVAERTIRSADEMLRVLDETFRVTPPAPIDEIFARTGAGFRPD